MSLGDIRFEVGPGVVTNGVDPGLLNTVKEATRYLPPGWRAVMTSGYRAGDPRFHGQGKALDIQLVNPQGQALPNYQSQENFRAYEQFAQAVHGLNTNGAPIRWGGYFGGANGPGGTYGATDLMHFDIGNVPMGGGTWEGGLTDAQKRLIPNAVSQGATQPGHPASGVDPYTGYYDAVAKAESGNQNIANKGGSTAYGFWQITQPTFNALAAAHPELGLTDRTNGDQQRKAMVALTSDNAKMLSTAGVPLTWGNLYMAHFLGGEGGVKFLTAMKNNPNASFASLFPKEAAANPGVSGGSLQQVFDRMSARLGAGSNTAVAGGGASAPGADKAPPPPAEPSPMETLGSMLGQAFTNYGGGSGGLQFTDPIDQPAIRSPALTEDFTPSHSPVPASLAAGAGSGIGQQLGQLAASPSDPMLVNPSVVPSITAGAPSMSAMIPTPGTQGRPGGPPNLMNPYMSPMRLS
jgi:hypothetical protein